MVCEEVIVYAGFQVAQTAIMTVLLGTEALTGALKPLSLFSVLTWIVLLLLLCRSGHKTMAWWFVAAMVGSGVLLDIALILSPEFRAKTSADMKKAAARA